MTISGPRLISISDPNGYGSHEFATEVHESDKPSHSAILGPDGRPLQYRRQPLGFDLTPRRHGGKP